MRPDPPEAVVFDIGNVLIQWDPHPAVAADVGNAEAERFLTADDFSFATWNHQQDAGRSLEEAEAEIAASWPHWLPHARSYHRHFDRSLLGPIDGAVAVLRELHRSGVPVFALTNFSAEFFPLAQHRFDFLGLFADIVVSGAEGTAKPAAEIFTILQHRIGRPAERCVFFDDTAANVSAARATGFDAFVFTDGDGLRQQLRARGLPLAETS